MSDGVVNDLVQAHFSNSEAVARYAEGPPRFVPGFADIHRMASVLLRERMPENGSLLVLGAGGGLELKALSEWNPGWTFVGIDPSAEMLALARTAVEGARDRVEFVHGYIDDAPAGPFAGATCLLTLHFLDRRERLRALRAIRQRLSPGAPFIVAHSSFPQSPDVRSRWLLRYRNFAVAAGAEARNAEHWRRAVEEQLTLLSPEEDEDLLREAGFTQVTSFYAAFTWRGWVAHA